MWSMEQTNLVLLFKLFTVLAVVILLFSRPFRGGRPPTPMHPLPADDAVLLRKRRRSKHALIRGSFRPSPWRTPGN